VNEATRGTHKEVAVVVEGREPKEKRLKTVQVVIGNREPEEEREIPHVRVVVEGREQEEGHTSSSLLKARGMAKQPGGPAGCR